MDGFFVSKHIGKWRKKRRWESTLNKIKEFWCKNRDEIIDLVINTKYAEDRREKKKEEIDKKIKREYMAIILLLIIGIIYVLSGSFLLLHLGQDGLFLTESQNIIIGYEMIILGIYALLYVAIFFSKCGNWEKYFLLKTIKAIVIFLMLPYHAFGKLIKSLIKGTRQEHVSQFFPYYLVSMLFVALMFAVVVKRVAGCGYDKAYNGIIGFVLVLAFIKMFFWCGKLFVYLFLKIEITSVEKAKVESTSKINWRGTKKDDKHRREKHEEFQKEWIVINKELEYSKIYFYIILAILILCIPKKPGSLSELLSNQFWGITTIAALSREVKSKKNDSDSMEFI